MKTKREFDFSQYSVGDVATFYNDAHPPYIYAHTTRGLILEIDEDSVLVEGGKYLSGLEIRFDRYGQQISTNRNISDDFYELLTIEQRSGEEKEKQNRLREEYKEISLEYKTCQDKAHEEMMELLQPFIKYVKDRNIRFSLNTLFSIPGHTPNINLTIHSLPLKAEKDRIWNLLDP